MSNRLLTGLTLIFIVGISLLFLLNYSIPLEEKIDIGFLSPNQVRGSAVEKNGKLWTLNFEQQKSWLSQLNHSTRYDQEITKEAPFTFDRLVIYRFNQEDLFLTPIGTDNGSLVFTFSDETLKESSKGAIEKLFAETYDK